MSSTDDKTYLDSDKLDYLEALFIRESKASPEFESLNRNEPEVSRLSRRELSEADAFADGVRTVLGVLGYEFLARGESSAPVGRRLEDYVTDYHSTGDREASSSGPDGLGTEAGSDDGIFHLTRNGLDGRLRVDGEDRFVLLAGSTVSKSVKEHMHASVAILRGDKVRSGVLREMGDVYVTTEDIEFETPSAAAQFVIGGSANGWKEFRDGEGPLDRIRKK